MDHLAMRQKVLPSLVSQEDSASISLLSSPLSTWETPVIRLGFESVFLFPWKIHSSPVLERGIRRHGRERQRVHAAHSQWLTSSVSALVTGESGSQHKGPSVWETRGLERSIVWPPES